MSKLNHKNQSINSHIQELRVIVIWCFVIFLTIFILCFYNIKYINNILFTPLLVTLNNHNLSGVVISTGLLEVFFSNIKLAFYSSVFIALPIILLVVYFYLLSVLNKNEKTIAIMVCIFTPLLFWLGAAVAYYLGFRVVLEFFISYSLSNNIQVLPKIAEYISLVLQILLAFGISFQIPIIIIIAGVLKIITAKDLLKFSKFAIVIAFVLAAIFTPPDPFSQIIMATVIMILYYISYLVLKLKKL